MNKHLRTKLSFLISSIIIIWLNYILVPNNILSYDVFGYYLYLPFKFIYHDLGLSHIDVLNGIVAKYNNTDTLYQINQLSNGTSVMKYSMGMSIFYAPFFSIGHGLAYLLDYPMDGFSLPYQKSIFLGGVIYSILGIWLLKKVLLRFFSDKVSAITLLLIVVATNILVHFSMYGQNAMSHNMLFFSYGLILWLTIKWHESYKTKYIVGLAIICGLSILSRPTEAVCLLIPAFWGISNFSSFKDKVSILLKYKWQIILFVSIIAIIGSFQLIYWKIYTGKFLFYSYGANAGEGLELLSPYLYEVLLSFRKGWLLYTPVMIFAIFGFVQIYKKNRFIFWSLFSYFVFNLYIVSSWTCWWYAQSYSQRSLIQSYPIMAIGLGYFIQWVFTQKKAIRTLFLLTAIGLVSLNLWQSFQYYTGTLHGDRMTRAYYLQTFGKLHASDEDRKLLLVNRSFNGEEIFENDGSYKKTDEFNSVQFKKISYDSLTELNLTTASKLTADSNCSLAINIPYHEITKKDHAWLRISAWVYPEVNGKESPFSLITHFTHNEFPYKYKAFDSEKMDLTLNKWNKISIDYITPEVRKLKDNLKVYIWLRGKKPLYIGNIKVEVFEKITD